jgi:hypothetical protein
MRRRRFFKRKIFVLLILLLVLILLISIDFKVWKPLEKKEVKMIPLIDRCSVLFNNLLHSIKDESSCENYCMAECSTRDMKFYKSEFSPNLEGCNTCNCYCK